jgi:hypothetical protein
LPATAEKFHDDDDDNNKHNCGGGGDNGNSIVFHSLYMSKPA